MGHDDIRGVGGTHARWEFDFTNVQGIADLEVADIDLNGLRQVVREAGDFDGVDVLFDQAAGLDPGGLAVEVGRNVGGDGGIFVDGPEICVQGFAGDWVVLEGLEKGETGAVAFDVEVDDDVFRTALREEVGEGLRIDLEVQVFGAFAVDDGGNPAFAAHLVETAGAGA